MTATINANLQSAADQLKESEELYRMLLETTTDAIVMFDDRNRISYANPSIEALVGYKPEELVGQDIALIQPERMRQGHRDGVARYLATRQKRLNWRAARSVAVHRDGREIPVEIAFSHMELDGKHRFAGFIRDTSDRVKAEAALRDSEERYRHIVQTANEGIWIVDAQACTSFVNPKMAEMLGYTSEEMQGRPLNDFMDDESRLVAAENIERRKQGISEQHDFRFRRKDGSDLWSILATTSLRDSSGEYAGAMALVTDITERKRLDSELRHSQKMEALGRMAGGIAHDFNNQIMVIQGYGALALASAPSAELTEALTQILNASERSAELVRQLLTFSRKGRHTVAPVDVHGLITGLLDVLGRSLSKKILLHTSLQASDAMIVGDAALLQNALLNLSLNARDAMPHGGDLRFATALAELDEVAVARLAADMMPGPYLQVTVSDTGEGMSEDVKKHLFEPFFSTKAPGQGTGLGLASVYGAIARHGGGIDVDSELGRGTTIHVYLPRTTPLPTSPESGRLEPAPPDAMTSARVLVIDDEVSVARVVTLILTELGYEVVYKRDGAVAVEHYREHWRTTDLVVLDMNMPAMSGAETFAAMRAINPAAKIVIMSGYSEEGGVEELLRQGALGFLAKPFRPEVIARQVAQILGAGERPAGS